jgi:hypothetical protein
MCVHPQMGNGGDDAGAADGAHTVASRYGYTLVWLVAMSSDKAETWMQRGMRIVLAFCKRSDLVSAKNRRLYEKPRACKCVCPSS